MNAPSNDLPLVSIVMPTFNRAHWVAGAIDSLLNLRTHDEFRYELIVVDNASSDNTAEVVKAAIEHARVPAQYVFSRPPGDAPTRNAGVRLAKGEWIAFFDDDQFATPDWLCELLRAARACDGRVLGGPVHLDLSNQQLEALGRLGRITLREIDFYQQLQPYTGKHLPGTGNALVHREVFDEVGLFDESMTMGGSDFNFFRAAREHGHELWYAPKAIIRHRIEPNRLTSAYHRWDAMSGSSFQATSDCEQHGKWYATASASARIARVLAVTMPNLIWAAATRNRGEVFSRRIQAWRTTGYLRGLLKALFPRLCKQTDYFKSIDFRLGREVGKKEAEQTAEKVEKAERANASNEKAGASSSTVRNPMMDNNVAATTSMQGRQQP